MYYDFLTRIKNAGRARKEVLHAPFSKGDFAVAKVLEECGYIAEAQKKTSGKKGVLEIRLRYREERPALSDFKIVSKPSRRVYAGYKELHGNKQGYGVAVLSTPQGIMTDKEARKKKVGGEFLFEVW